MTDETDDFDGCSRLCRKRGTHTLAWGDCDYAEKPAPQPPEFGFWRTFDAGDGCMSISMATIPLLAVLPWAEHLTVDEQRQMLEEAADSQNATAVMNRWYRDACSKANAEDRARMAAGEEP